MTGHDGLAIRVREGDWGGAPPSNVEAVARSAAACFTAYDDDEPLAILVEPTPGANDSPMALSTLAANGEFVVRLNVRGTLWARLAYQFAHEYCHVLADPRTFTADRYAWIEEALCETASLFALREMARTWAEAPPYANWGEYAVHLRAYAQKLLAEPARSLPPGEEFAAWLGERLPLLETDPGRRADATVIAAELLPLFEGTTWRCVRRLHAFSRAPASSPDAFMRAWASACPPELRALVEAIAAAIRVPDADR